MIALVVGILLGAALATPLIPLLRVSDMPAGRAAAGIAVIAVAVFAIQFWLRLRDADHWPFGDVLGLATQVTLNVWPVYAVAALVAVLGTFGTRRA